MRRGKGVCYEVGAVGRSFIRGFVGRGKEGGFFFGVVENNWRVLSKKVI